MGSGSLPPGWQPAAAQWGGGEHLGAARRGAQRPPKGDTGSARPAARTQTLRSRGFAPRVHASPEPPPGPQSLSNQDGHWEGDAPTSPALRGSAQGLSPHGLGSARPPAPQPSPQPAPCGQLSTEWTVKPAHAPHHRPPRARPPGAGLVGIGSSRGIGPAGALGPGPQADCELGATLWEAGLGQSPGTPSHCPASPQPRAAGPWGRAPGEPQLQGGWQE